MSKLYKVAKMFQQKLSLAAAGNLQNLKSIYQVSRSLAKTKDLWVNAGSDPYDDQDPNVAKAVDDIVTTSSRGYSQAITQGMPAVGQFGYDTFLNKMDQKVQTLEDLGPFPKLDPTASNTLGELKQTLAKARSEFVPIGIPAPAQEITLPQDTIYGKPPAQPSGAAYNAEEDPTSFYREDPTAFYR